MLHPDFVPTPYDIKWYKPKLNFCSLVNRLMLPTLCYLIGYVLQLLLLEHTFNLSKHQMLHKHKKSFQSKQQLELRHTFINTYHIFKLYIHTKKEKFMIIAAKLSLFSEYYIFKIRVQDRESF